MEYIGLNLIICGLNLCIAPAKTLRQHKPLNTMVLRDRGFRVTTSGVSKNETNDFRTWLGTLHFYTFVLQLFCCLISQPFLFPLCR